MDDLIYLYAVCVTLAAVLVTICVWSPRRVRIKLTALAVATLFIPLAYGSLSDLLSRPKPVSLEWVRRAAEEATVLGTSMREGEAIYVWLQLAGVQEPRAYALPWHQATARQLMQARRDAERRGQRLKMARPFEKSLDRNQQKFYPEPQQKLPTKSTPSQKPLEF
ncbi:MAG: hypothetical protein QNJ94_06600 [Alphaproteobacteria bacterium]|nr:hypothetical protein [Alphaproteobacteria bacterium]